MNYNKLEEIVSKPRLKRYKQACNGNEQQAIKLYNLNVALSQFYYPYLSMFEVAFRNAIDVEMRRYFNNDSWQITENRPDGFVSTLAASGDSYMKQTVNKIFAKYDNRATHLHIISEVSLGFWTRFFKRNYFRLLQGRPIHIFKNATIGIQRTDVSNTLRKIQQYRNRIYHNEPICFVNRQVDVTAIETLYIDLNRIMTWISADIIQFVNNAEKHQSIIRQIKNLR